MTEAEKRLWYLMRRHNLESKLFRRQVPISDYVIDFACLAERLLIEIDGGQHAAQAQQDARRTAWLERRGFRVMRFWNNEVLGNTEGVLETIVAAVKEQAAKRLRTRRPLEMSTSNVDRTLTRSDSHVSKVYRRFTE